MRAWESAVKARRRGPLWARFFALTALLAVGAGVIYVVLQPPTGGSDQLPLGAPVATATAAPVVVQATVAPASTATAAPVAVQATVAPASTAVTNPIAGLPAGAVPFRDHYYLVVNESMGWPEAKAYAESLGGYLVAIGDEDENLFVADMAGANGVVSIGLTDEAFEGRFVWANGEPLVYTNWGAGEPNSDGDEDFVCECGCCDV